MYLDLGRAVRAGLAGLRVPPSEAAAADASDEVIPLLAPFGSTFMCYRIIAITQKGLRDPPEVALPFPSTLSLSAASPRMCLRPQWPGDHIGTHVCPLSFLKSVVSSHSTSFWKPSLMNPGCETKGNLVVCQDPESIFLVTGHRSCVTCSGESCANFKGRGR